MKNVLVTGANGHLGLAVVQLLVQNGYRVRAGVRDPENPDKTQHLRNLDVEICHADLLAPDSLAKAAEGVDGVFQVAAVYKMWARYVCFSHEKAARDLGWQPMDLRTSVRDTLRWMRDTPSATYC